MKKLIVVADWANDSLTCQEYRSAVDGFRKNQDISPISFVSSTSSTIHTSFLTRQIIETELRYGDPMQTILFQNTDPRLQAEERLQKAQGAEFIVIKLQNGMIVCGPNAGYDFSLITPYIQVVFSYPNLDEGSQFRSRDLYSRVCAHLLDELEDELALEEVPSSIIPRIQDYYVGHIDNYGNIKTTISQSVFKGKYEYGDTIEITIGKVKKKVRYLDNLFGGSVGEPVIYPGSSGDIKDPYIEVSSWSHFNDKEIHTGSYFFDYPVPGTQIFFT